MDVTQLVELGLTEPQAKTYLALLDLGSATPPEISEKTNEKRSNTYKLLDKLCEMGLASKEEVNKKLTYFPNSPAALEQLVSDRLSEASHQQRKLKASLPSLLEQYHKKTERPGVRYFQGKEGIREIYDDQIKTNQKVLYIRSTADVKLYDYETMRKLRGIFALAGVPRHVFSPDAPDIPINWRETDKLRMLERTHMRSNDYTAAVEWGVYGDKVSIISFGEEAMGMIIESPQIAEGMRQILKLMDEGLRSRKDYDKMPTKASVKVTGDLRPGKGTHVFTKGKL
jgi:sugar-specific transcriptional regulator TrmB